MAKPLACTSDRAATGSELGKADVILVGVSRSGKTPTCLYMALQLGIKAANYPLTPDDFDRGTLPAVLDLYRSVDDVGAAGERLAAALRPLDRPALVLWGRRDPYLPVAHAERQREAFPGAEVRVLERSGHWPFVDDPAAVAAAVDRFLAGLPERRAIGVA